jgi:hypothetical protein
MFLFGDLGNGVPVFDDLAALNTKQVVEARMLSASDSRYNTHVRIGRQPVRDRVHQTASNPLATERRKPIYRRTVEKRTFLNRFIGTEVRSTFD